LSRLAIKITQEASKALSDMPMMTLFPIFPFVCVVGYFIWWIYTATILFSVTTSHVVSDPEFDTVLFIKPPTWPKIPIPNTNTVSQFLSIGAPSSVSQFDHGFPFWMFLHPSRLATWPRCGTRT
jgi:hypothetical protein